MGDIKGLIVDEVSGWWDSHLEYRFEKKRDLLRGLQTVRKSRTDLYDKIIASTRAKKNQIFAYSGGGDGVKGK